MDKIKIALATKDKSLDCHFGHCEYFTVYDVDMNEKAIINENKIEAPSGCGCSSNIASILKDHDVNVLLTNNLGGKVLKRLEANEIEVVLGCTGNVYDATIAWMQGKIKKNPFVCFDHK